jgi:hypothetical protein
MTKEFYSVNLKKRHEFGDLAVDGDNIQVDLE